MDNMFFSCPYCEETLLRYVTNKSGHFGHAQCSGCLKTGPIIVTRGLDGPDEEWHKIANWAFHESILWEKRDMNPVLNDTDIENLTGETVANMIRRNYERS